MITLIVGWNCSCGQDEIEWPNSDTGASGSECGSWYPLPDSSGESGNYSVKKDEIIGCLVWETALKADQTTYINIGDLYLKAKAEKNASKHIVIFISARNCPICEEMAIEIAERKSDFEQINATMIGLAAKDTQRTEEHHLTLEEADEVLLEEGWPKEWYRINDEENHLSNYHIPTPQIVVIDMLTMKVLSAGSSQFTKNNIDGLVSFLENGK